MIEPAFVLDASVTMSWCFEDEGVPYSNAVLDSLGKVSAVTPPIWMLEIGNVLITAERRGRLTKPDSIPGAFVKTADPAGTQRFVVNTQ